MTELVEQAARAICEISAEAAFPDDPKSVKQVYVKANWKIHAPEAQAAIAIALGAAADRFNKIAENWERLSEGHPNLDSALLMDVRAEQSRRCSSLVRAMIPPEGNQ